MRQHRFWTLRLEAIELEHTIQVGSPEAICALLPKSVSSMRERSYGASLCRRKFVLDT